MELKMSVCVLVVLVCFCSGAYGIDVGPDFLSFSSAIKAGLLEANKEKVLYEHNTGQPGVITEQWFTGIDVMDENMRIRIYIDGETEASLDFQLLLAHGIGFTEAMEEKYIPWGTRRIAHAADGGIYNTYRIPFYESFRVTATHPTGGQFFYIIRGVENLSVVVGDLELPPYGTRLRLYKNVNVKLSPLEFISLVDVKNTAGMLYQVTLAANSTDFNYLEACMRAVIDGSPNTTWLSSGTEDFFLSAYYFNRGTFHHDNSGLTYLSKSPASVMSAYKFFENDPLLFTKSLQLIWRCGETINTNSGCPNDWPPPDSMPHGGSTPKLADTTVTTYAWVYEYSF
jgi:hypothetical protein